MIFYHLYLTHELISYGVKDSISTYILNTEDIPGKICDTKLHKFCTY